MTQEDYILQAWNATWAMVETRGISPMDASVEQAWDAFLAYLAFDPFSRVGMHYPALGTFFREHFSELWPLFQYEVYQAMMQLEG